MEIIFFILRLIPAACGASFIAFVYFAYYSPKEMSQYWAQINNERGLPKLSRTQMLLGWAFHVSAWIGLSVMLYGALVGSVSWIIPAKAGFASEDEYGDSHWQSYRHVTSDALWFLLIGPASTLFFGMPKRGRDNETQLLWLATYDKAVKGTKKERQEMIVTIHRKILDLEEQGIGPGIEKEMFTIVCEVEKLTGDKAS